MGVRAILTTALALPDIAPGTDPTAEPASRAGSGAPFLPRTAEAAKTARPCLER